MVKHKGTIKIKTDRLVLRPFSFDDAEDVFYNYINDDDILEYLCQNKISSVNEIRYILSQFLINYTHADYYNWAIEYKQKVIGNIYVKLISNYNSNCEIEYCIGSQFRNRSLMTESAQAIIDYLLNSIKFRHIIAKNNYLNIPSRRVLQKSGMEYAGLFQKHLLRKSNCYADLEVFYKSSY